MKTKMARHTVYGKYLYWFYEVNTLLMDNSLYFLQGRVYKLY